MYGDSTNRAVSPASWVAGAEATLPIFEYLPYKWNMSDPAAENLRENTKDMKLELKSLEVFEVP